MFAYEDTPDLVFQNYDLRLYNVFNVNVYENRKVKVLSHCYFLWTFTVMKIIFKYLRHSPILDVMMLL